MYKRQVDGFLYAWDDNNNEIIQIDASGDTIGIGVPPEMLAANAQNVNFNAGAMDANNNLFLGEGSAAGGNNSQVWMINLDTFTATHITAATYIQPEPGSIGWANNNGFGDMAFNPVDSKLYFRGASGNDLFTLQPFTGDYYRSSAIGGRISGPLVPSSVIGQWFDSLGDLFFYQADGNVYRVVINQPLTDATRPTSELVSAGASVGTGDAAACSYQPAFTKSISQGLAAPGDTVTYTFEITNALPAGSIGDPLNVSLTDTIPAGLEIDKSSITVSGAAGAITDATVDGSSDLDITAIPVGPESTVTVTVDATIPTDAAPGDYTCLLYTSDAADE